MTAPDIDDVYRDLRDVLADSLSDFDEISYTYETGESALAIFLAISGAASESIPVPRELVDRARPLMAGEFAGFFEQDAARLAQLPRHAAA